ncbi:MAG: hypothetical protein SGPRY_008286 [Prymnesium sp.]
MGLACPRRAASFQRVAVGHLVVRTARAIEWARALEPALTCVVVAGGVAANMRVRSELANVAATAGLPMVCPPLRLCTDNGVMVAWTAMQRLRLGLGEKPLSTQAEPEMVEMCVEVRPRWPIGPRDARSTTQQQQLSKRKQGQATTAAQDAVKQTKKRRATGQGEESVGHTRIETARS